MALFDYSMKYLVLFTKRHQNIGLLLTRLRTHVHMLVSVLTRYELEERTASTEGNTSR